MTLTGTIFDIQRTSLHDGPGIRTAVFLKGCPLHCLWCHNPESQSKTKEISFRPESCAVCGECITTCQHGAHRILDGVHIYDRSLCEACGDCVGTCLYEALKLAGQEQTVEQVMAVVLRDRLFYEQSGGGLTISGGEPMLQPEFTLALLKAAKAEGLHTCLDTCGWTSQRAYEQVLPFVDLFLFDYKATNAEIHKKLTGVSNELILSNLAFLAQHGAIIRLRCPLVPGINDSIEHIKGIASLHRRYPGLDGIDLMAYHNVGNAKYERYGLENPIPNLKTTPESTKQAWLEALHRLGCENATLG
ncbi:MAG: glycyl-radical enzyme activating protein [Anaerolineales bacterium]